MHKRIYRNEFYVTRPIEDSPIKPGMAIYSRDNNSLTFNICRWYLYPIFRAKYLLKVFKYMMYCKFNKLGLMQTSVGNTPQLKDLDIKKYIMKGWHKWTKNR